MNIMLCLCAISFVMAIMLLLTKFLSKKRKWILVAMEVIATLLLFFDRLAYIYAGNPSSTGYIMVRLSNFIVFFMTSAIVFCFNLYLIDLLKNEGKQTSVPRRLIFTGFTSVIGMLLVIISVFTGLYYYFDSQNFYHRGPGFLLCYLIPVLCPIIQFTSVIKFRKCFSKLIYIALWLYIFLPIIMGIIQIFAYGISIVNMTMVLVSVSLYFFSYLDVNAAAEKAHEIEIQYLKNEYKNIQNFFSQASKAITSLIEKDKEEDVGKSERIADISREIAQRVGKDEEECNKIYYAGFLCEVGADALSYIKEYPFLSESSLYLGERYDGKDNKHKIKGDDIPEYARIITVAKDYEYMMNNPTIPSFFIRDYFIRNAGEKYDPLFAKMAVLLIDAQTNSEKLEVIEENVETELFCEEYRQNITRGIEITQNITEVTFECSSINSEIDSMLEKIYETDEVEVDSQNNLFKKTAVFSYPSIILFDSSDKVVQKTQESIDAHKYIEYGEIWFDSHIISTSAKNMEVRNVKDLEEENVNDSLYKITFCRFEDHVLVKMHSSKKYFEVIVALPSASKSIYIGITGENINIRNIQINVKEEKVREDDIPRISEKDNYINRIESDIPNIQIVRPLAVFTKEIEIKDNLKIYFHTQSFPDANLVWHCPYIILYSSDDKKVYGKNYHEYAMIKFDGEENGSNEFAENEFFMKKTENFKGWDDWESQNKAGYECQIDFIRLANVVTLKTLNKGIFIQNVTTIKDGSKDVYVALSGDQIALSDIRIR